MGRVAPADGRPPICEHLPRTITLADALAKDQAGSRSAGLLHGPAFARCALRRNWRFHRLTATKATEGRCSALRADPPVGFVRSHGAQPRAEHERCGRRLELRLRLAGSSPFAIAARIHNTTTTREDVCAEPHDAWRVPAQHRQPLPIASHRTRSRRD